MFEITIAETIHSGFMGTVISDSAEQAEAIADALRKAGFTVSIRKD